MTGPAPMVAAPDGWHPHQLWHDLELELHARHAGLAAAFLCIAVLILGRAALPSSERWRVLIGLAMVALYLVLLPVKAALLATAMDALYCDAQLVALVALAWAVVAAAAVILFDLVGRRFGVPKIVRDLVVIVGSMV